MCVFLNAFLYFLCTFNVISVSEDEYQTGTGGSLYDGRQQVLYWADVLSELALVVPSPETFKLRSLSTSESGLESRL